MATPNPSDPATAALVDYLSKVMDTNDTLAEFMETAAQRLLDGDSPQRIAHYLKENALTIRGTREIAQRAIDTLLLDG